MADYIFTKIIRSEIPSYKIYEDDRTYAFLDIHPATDGHTLVIPKEQIEFVWDLADEDYRAVMATVQKLARHLRERLDVPYVGLKVVGTDVPHAHVHLVPFNNPGEYNRTPDLSAQPDHARLADMAKKLAF